MRYLITGGLGVIGSHIARKLLDSGNGVIVVDACEEPRNQWLATRLGSDARVTIVKKRIEAYPITMTELVHSADAVIHCAAHTGIPHSLLAPDDDWRSNVDATRVLLEALRKAPRPTVVLSSVKPYRVLPMPLDGLDENTVIEPDEPYAASKAAQSMLCQSYARSYGLPVVTFRCSNLYGPGPCHGPRHGWATWFCISAAIGRAIEVQGSGEQERDILHADDVLSACLLAIENMTALKGDIFNLGGGRDNIVSVSYVANLLRELGDGRLEITKGPARTMDDDRVFVDTKKFYDATGWQPKVHSLDGIRDVLAWAMSHRDELRAVYEGV